MKIKFIQKLIDKIRRKNNNIDVQSVMQQTRKIMKKNGYIFDTNHKIITPDGICFNDDDVTAYEIFEVFLNKDYEFYYPTTERLVFIDVGMNIGASTLFFANLKNTKNVYAFEPFKPTYKQGLKNIELNNIKSKIKTFNFGLDKENQRLKIEYNKNQSGCMSTTFNAFEVNKELCKEVESIEKIEIKDAGTILKPIIEEHKNDNIILKIDTEGAEYNIFESLDNANLLKDFKVIMLEYHFKSPQELEDRLTKNGFIVWYKNQHNIGEKTGMIYAIKITK